jgi:hypothetical protein
MIYLFTTYYKSDNEERQKELDYCLDKNIKNKLISHIYLFSEVQITVTNPEKVTVICIESKPMFSTYFSYINSSKLFKKSINIIANSDIYFDDTLSLLYHYFVPNRNIILALAKWEYDFRKKTFKVHKNGRYSQDSWIFNGHIKECFSDITQGENNCDNRIAYELAHVPYQVLNPATRIKTYHIHQSNHRTYDMKKGISGPTKEINIT